jgi:hypothetical protein
LSYPSWTIFHRLINIWSHQLLIPTRVLAQTISPFLELVRYYIKFLKKYK